MLPTVNFLGLNPSRLIIGANPFGGFSHQNKQRNEEMKNFHTVNKIVETWGQAWEAGINTFITNNETEHVVEAVRKYQSADPKMQWIAQVSFRTKKDMFNAIDEVVGLGCRALYFHGKLSDDLYTARDEKTIRSWCEYTRKKGIPVGAAGHDPETHLWIDSLDVVDFHTVCFFNCGSVHEGKGEKFRLGDVFNAVRCIQQIKKPCIAYKIMGAGRIDPQMAFNYAFEHIKPGDVVNVGMHRGDKDNIVFENAEIVSRILGEHSG